MADRHVDFLLIGGGPAATSCASQLREQGTKGSIILVSRELDAPYDRTNVSKDYLQGGKSREQTLLHPLSWYTEHGIELLTRTSVMKLDTDARVAKLSNKEEISFDKVLIATGAMVRRLNVPGAELSGIHYLRALSNADKLRDDAAGKRVVLIGGSYIATEVAASLTLLGSKCTLVMMEAVTLENGFGKQAGQFFQDQLVAHGVEIHGGQELDHFEGADGHVTHVVTKSGLKVEADAVVIGVGATPDVMLAKAAGLQLGQSGGVKVNDRLETSVPGIYAAGDCAEYDSVIHGHSLRIEHYDVAENQGKAAARNMLGADKPYDVVPYFFSDIADWASIEYVGPAKEWDKETVHGSISDGEFSVFYEQDGKVIAALSVGRSDDLEEARKLIAGD